MANKTIKRTPICPAVKFEQAAKIGWWEVDFQDKSVVVSDYLVHLFNLDSPFVTLSLLKKLIVAEHQREIMCKIVSAKRSKAFKQTFQMHSRHGKIWVRVELADEEHNEEGKSIAYGYMQQVEAPKADELTHHQASNLYRQQNATSHLSYFTSDDSSVEKIVFEILENFVYYFNANKAYLVKANAEERSFYFVDEVRSTSEPDLITNIPSISYDSYGETLLEQLANGEPIALRSIDELPEDAQGIKEIVFS